MIKLNLSCAFFRILWLARLIMAADKHSSYNIILGTHHIYRKFILMPHCFPGMISMVMIIENRFLLSLQLFHLKGIQPQYSL